MFEGIDLSWNRIPGGAQVGELLQAVHRMHDPSNPAASLPGLVRAREALARLLATPAGRSHAVLLRHKARELDEVIRSCSGLWLEAVATRHTLSPGDSIQVDVTAINRSSARAPAHGGSLRDGRARERGRHPARGESAGDDDPQERRAHEPRLARDAALLAARTGRGGPVSTSRIPRSSERPRTNPRSASRSPWRRWGSRSTTPSPSSTDGSIGSAGNSTDRWSSLPR